MHRSLFLRFGSLVAWGTLGGCNSLMGIEPPLDTEPKVVDSGPAVRDATEMTGDDGDDRDDRDDRDDGDNVAPHGDASASERVDRWIPILSTDDAPSDRVQHSAVWTGKEMIVWGGRYIMSPAVQTGGRYDPSTQTWRATSLVEAPFARAYHSAVWTGAEMIIWAGSAAGGGRYDPENDRWRPMADGRLAEGRSGHHAAWTGSEMIVWCGIEPGQSPQGERYLPSRDEWRDMSASGAPPCTTDGTAVWTGQELIVWGGTETQDGPPTNRGGTYNPTSDKWRPITTVGAPAPRISHSAVWNGSKMMIWGGENIDAAGVHIFADGGMYDPVLDRWEELEGALGIAEHLAVWAPARGQRPGLMLTWGGTIQSADGQTHLLGEGNVYDPVLRAWHPMSMSGEPWPRTFASVVWTGNEMIVWGGIRALVQNGSTGRDGGRYTP